jgi:hypothetical protein
MWLYRSGWLRLRDAEVDDPAGLWDVLSIPHRPPVDVEAIVGALGVAVDTTGPVGCLRLEADAEGRGSAALQVAAEEAPMALAQGLARLLRLDLSHPVTRTFPVRPPDHPGHVVAFALGLLMPDWLVENEARAGHGLETMAARFGVSEELMRLRLRRLGWI